MFALLETLGVVGLAAAGIGIGLVLSRRRRLWMLGFTVSLVFVIAFALASRFLVLTFVPPFSWITAGRTEYALYALFVPMAFATLTPRLPHRRQRRVVAIGVAFCTVYLSLPHFLLPALTRGYFESLTTTFDKADVCIQSNGYTCGPAAAVTALRRLGFAAEEGEVAILAYTTALKGTAPDCLCHALRKGWGAQGLVCEYRSFSSLDELRRQGLTITVIKLSLLLDHYVTVFDVTDDEVVFGDPLRGKRSLTHEKFLKEWRYTGIVLKRRG
jgi:predicted double-glycine peptidase